MSRPRKIIDWDGVAAAYVEGDLTLKEIGAAYNVTAGSICHRAKLEDWPARARASKRTQKSGATFQWRLARALDNQLKELEDRWSDGAPVADAAQAEKEARTLNVLIRTAEKLKELEVMASKKSGAKGDTTNQSTARLDRKRLRETLERRLDKLIAAADARGLSREPVGGGERLFPAPLALLGAPRSASP